MKGYRKLIFFASLLAVAVIKLEGAELSSVLVTLATAFGFANAVENYKPKDMD